MKHWWCLLVVSAVVGFCTPGCALIKDWWNNNGTNIVDVVTNVVPPVTTNVVNGPTAPDGFVWGQWTWLTSGRAPRADAKYRTDVAFQSVGCSAGPGGKFSLDYGTYKWTFSGGDPYCDACWGVAYKIGDKWYAGMCDYFPRNRAAYANLLTTENLYRNDTGHKKPDGRTPWVFILYSYDGSEYAWWPVTWPPTKWEKFKMWFKRSK